MSRSPVRPVSPRAPRSRESGQERRRRCRPRRDPSARAAAACAPCSMKWSGSPMPHDRHRDPVRGEQIGHCGSEAATRHPVFDGDRPLGDASAIALSSGASGLTNRASTTVVEIPWALSCSCACIATSTILPTAKIARSLPRWRMSMLGTATGSRGSVLADGAAPARKAQRERSLLTRGRWRTDGAIHPASSALRWSCRECSADMPGRACRDATARQLR